MAIIVGGNFAINGTSGSPCTWSYADITSIGGTATASYVTVSNSTSGSTITVTNGTDGGGNSGWSFASAFTAIRDSFIAPLEVSLGDHAARSWDNVSAVGPMPTPWTVHLGSLSIYNAYLDRTQIDRFRVMRPAGITTSSIALHDTEAPTDFRVTAIVGAKASRQPGIIVCATDHQTFVEARFSGFNRINIYTVVANVGTSVYQSLASSVLNDREHQVEIEVVSGTLSLYIDNVLMTTYDVSAFTGRKWGFVSRGTTNDGLANEAYLRDIKCEAHSAITRHFVDISDTGSLNDGTLAEPYNSLATVKAAIEANPSGSHRWCFRAGVNHGLGLVLSGSTGAHLDGYDPAATDFRWALAGGTLNPTFTATGVNGEYTTPVAASGTLMVFERVAGGSWEMMDGNVSETAPVDSWTVLGGLGRIPAAGSLAAGQWARSGTSAYIKPTSGVPADNDYLVVTSTTLPLNLTNCSDVIVEGLETFGSYANGGIWTESGGSGLTLRRCLTWGHKRGVAIGGDTGVISDVNIEQCEARWCDWKGIADVTASAVSATDGLRIVGCYVADITSLPSRAGDAEAYMASVGGDNVQWYMNKAYRVGPQGVYTVPTLEAGLCHPTAYTIDCANNFDLQWNRAWEIDTWCTFEAAEALNIDNGYIGNNIAIECGDSSDTGLGSHQAFVLGRARNDRVTSTPRTVSGVVVEHNTIVDCAFGDARYDHGVFVGHGVNNSCTVDYICRNNIIDESDASRRWVAGFNLNTGYVNIALDRNVYPSHGALGADAYKHQYSGGVVKGDRADMIGGWLDQNYVGDTGATRDANSVFADALLDADYRPSAGSPAIGLAVDSLASLDFYLGVRSGASAGAVEYLPAGNVIEAALIFAGARGLAPVANAGLVSTVPLSLDLAVASGALAGLQGVVAFARALDKASTTANFVEAAVAIGAVRGVGFGRTATVEAMTDFGTAHGLSDGASADIEALQTLAQGHDLQTSALMTLSATLSVGLGRGLHQDGDASGPQTIEASLQIGVARGIEALTVASLYAAMTLNSQSAITVDGGQAIITALTVALRRGDAVAAEVSIGGLLDLGIAKAMTGSATATMSASAALSRQAVLQLVAGAVLDAGFALSCIRSVAVDGFALVVGLQTPDGRTITIRSEDRTISIQ